jgi:3-hydroxybutyrate dehydrogenase
MLTGRCAVITGSTHGLGFAVAESLANAGASVVLNGLCARDEGEAAASRLASSSGAEVIFHPADLRDVRQIEGLIADAAARFGTVSIAVNNAVVRHFAPVEKLTAEQWEMALAVNLSAGFHIARLAIPAMRNQGWGRIVNMASIYASRADENRIGYVTTKTALLGMTRAIAIETAADGITCNAICPGSIATPAIMGKIEQIASDEGVTIDEAAGAYIASRHPTRRFVEAVNVGALVTFLCSPAGQDITGATLPIDGGWLAR